MYVITSYSIHYTKLYEIIQEETIYDSKGKAFSPKKNQLRKEFKQRNISNYTVSLNKTEEIPELLDTYHDNIAKNYIKQGKSDEDLDTVTYSA